MTHALALTALGIATPLGRGKQATAANLFAGSREGLVERHDLLFGRTVTVGVVDGPLPPARPVATDCRNNRLMQLVLDEIGEAVKAAVRRFGPERIAVVLGTSTSGIAEGGEAAAIRHATGAWPAGFTIAGRSWEIWHGMPRAILASPDRPIPSPPPVLPAARLSPRRGG